MPDTTIDVLRARRADAAVEPGGPAGGTRSRRRIAASAPPWRVGGRVAVAVGLLKVIHFSRRPRSGSKYPAGLYRDGRMSEAGASNGAAAIEAVEVVKRFAAVEVLRTVTLR